MEWGWCWNEKSALVHQKAWSPGVEHLPWYFPMHHRIPKAFPSLLSPSVLSLDFGLFSSLDTIFGHLRPPQFTCPESNTTTKQSWASCVHLYITLALPSSSSSYTWSPSNLLSSRPLLTSMQPNPNPFLIPLITGHWLWKFLTLIHTSPFSPSQVYFRVSLLLGSGNP